MSDRVSDPLLTEQEVQAETRAPSRNTVKHWMSTGKLAWLKVGRKRLIRRSELDRFLAECEAASARRPSHSPMPKQVGPPPAMVRCECGVATTEKDAPGHRARCRRAGK